MFERLFVGALVVGALVGFALPGGKTPATNDAVQHVATESPSVSSGSVDRASLPFETILERAQDGHFYVNARVNGQPVKFLIDTGATGVALTPADAQRAGIQTGFDQPEVVGRGVSGDVRGHFVNIHHVEVDRKEAWDLRGAVITDGLDVSLLGQNFLSRVASVQISGDRMVLK